MRSSRGQTLVGVLIAAVLAGIVLIVMMKTLVLGIKSEKHVGLKDEMHSLRDTLAQLADCERTFALGNAGGPVNPETDCLDTETGGVAKPLLLFDPRGRPVTEPLTPITGTFDPLASGFGGSGRLGEWRIRTYCDRQLATLVVRVARPGGTGFLADPLTKRELGWTNETMNPMFGGAATRVCVERMLVNDSVSRDIAERLREVIDRLPESF